MSARPSASAASSSFTKSPLPPTLASDTSRISSPRVLIPRISISHDGYNRRNSPCTNSDCHIASRLLREAITIRFGILGIKGKDGVAKACRPGALILTWPKPALASGLCQGLHLCPLPAADRQSFLAALDEDRPVRLGNVPLQTLEPPDQPPRDQAVAVNADEQRGEFRLQLRKRRLDQIIDRVHFERLDGVPVVRGDEDHRGRHFEQLQMARELDARHSRHVDIDQSPARGLRGEKIQALEPAPRLADNGVRHLRPAVIEQIPQPRPCRRLVVDYEHPERSHRALLIQRFHRDLALSAVKALSYRAWPCRSGSARRRCRCPISLRRRSAAAAARGCWGGA